MKNSFFYTIIFLGISQAIIWLYYIKKKYFAHSQIKDFISTSKSPTLSKTKKQHRSSTNNRYATSQNAIITSTNQIIKNKRQEIDGIPGKIKHFCVFF